QCNEKCFPCNLCIEAKEACDWLRAAGFPQYVQLFKDSRFPIDIEWAKSDHHFLDKDALESLLCVCASKHSIILILQAQDCDEEDSCAISPKWTYDRRTRRWRRLNSELDFLPSPDSPTGPRNTSLCDVSDHHDVCSIHSSSSTESEGHDDEQETSRSSSRCSSTNKPPSLDTSFSGPPSPGGSGGGSSTLSLEAERCFPDKPPRKKGPSLLRKMEKLRLRGTSTLPIPTHSSPASNQARLVISEPLLAQDRPTEEDRLGRLQYPQCKEMGCLLMNSSFIFTSFPPSLIYFNLRASTPSPFQDYRNQINNNNNSRHDCLVFQIPHGHKPGTFPTSLTHKNTVLSPSIDSTSINWRTGSFHGYRGRHSSRRSAPSPATDNLDSSSSTSRDVSGVHGPLSEVDHRASIYDNVPDQQLFKSEGGSGGSGSDAERTSEEIEVSHMLQENQQLHWSSEQSLPSLPTCPGVESQSVSQFLLLQKLCLLKLTALMDRYSPSSKQGWNWTVPKPLRKAKASEVKGRRVFGVPLLVSVQQSGEPLPPSILRALVYLRSECLDQVGLFRKSGVKSRIQYLRELVEADPDGVSYDSQSAFDVADMVKQYFRDLPEPIFTSRLCESFLHIYQYFPKDQQLVAAQAAILLLPDENREALRTLLFFLRDVVACVDENQMTPTNIAVCLAPSLFHLNTLKRDANAPRSTHRKYSLGRPDQKDLSENLAATQGLASMVTEAVRLFQVPEPQELFHRWTEEELEERRSRLELNTQQLLKEAREKSRGWHGHSAPESVELAYKKVDDGCPLWLWRGGVEVDAPQKELLHRLLREPAAWEGELRQAAVVQSLSKDADVYRCVLQGHMAGVLALSNLVSTLLFLLNPSRIWQSDPSLGPLYLSSVSTEHPEVPVEGPRAHVHSCLYLLEPLGARKTRLTHLCRTDTRGRSREWHSKVSGHLLASKLLAIRDSFRPDHRETKI
uniref:Si:dkeyp-23e4.3 n=1 Tax=Myripristis murdjan TaxID=586833 RepID=A0A667Y627_9TELE